MSKPAKAAFRAQQINEKTIRETAAANVARSSVGDSFQNFAAQVGLGTGNLSDSGAYGFGLQSRNRTNLEAAYRSSWICGLAVDVVAQDMTRAGIDLQASDLPPKDASKLHHAFDKLRIWDSLCKTVKWSRLYGGAIAVMLIDGQKPNTPLNIDRIAPGAFKGLLVLDRWQISPSVNDLVEDYGPDLGQPKFYLVQQNAQALRGLNVHYSRVIRLEGLELPYQQKMTENGWGQSVLERLWDRLTAFDSTSDGAAQLVYKAHLRVIKIKSMRENVAQGGAALKGLTAQVEMMRAMQRNEGITMMDSQDEFEAHSYTFAGLDNLLEKFGEQISGATQIPLVRLFGQSPGGMNSTGESDLRTYYDNINQQQDAMLRLPIGGRLLPVMAKSVLNLSIRDGIGFDFVPLWQMSAEQKATVTKTLVDAIVAAEGMGAISPQVVLKELKQMSLTTGTFTHISDEDINAADAEPPDPTEIIKAEAEAKASIPGKQQDDPATTK